MPQLSPETVRQVYDDALAFEFNRRSQGMTLAREVTPQEHREIQQVALEAVARAQLMVAAPATNEHPLFKRLARQARQLDHARNTLSDQASDALRSIIDQQYTWTVMVAELGVQPAEKWEPFTEAVIEANVGMVAHLVAMQFCTLPPAEHDHD